MPVYFMQDKNTNLIKIGTVSKDLYFRHKTLEREFSTTLRILGVVNGGLKKEKQLHKKFSHIRTHREWFEPSSDLIGFIKQNSRQPNPEEIKTSHILVFRTPKSLIDQAKKKPGIFRLALFCGNYLSSGLKGILN